MTCWISSWRSITQPARAVNRSPAAVPLLAVSLAVLLTPSRAIADDQPVNPDVNLVFSGETLVAAFLLIAIIMALHGLGMLLTLRVHNRLVPWFGCFRSTLAGIAPIVVGSWMILVTHVLEVLVWTLFIRWQRAIPDLSDAPYFSMLQYTTVGSRFTLPFRWRGLEGALAMSGWLTFAWSAGVLMAMAFEFQKRQFDASKP